MAIDTTDTTIEPERTPNVELLRRVLEHITAHPEEHDQRVWARHTDCGTAMCLAGHAVTITGHAIDYGKHSWSGLVYLTRAGESIEDVAARELGLSDDQAENLFDPDNTRAELWREAAQITDGAIEIPAEIAAQIKGGWV